MILIFISLLLISYSVQEENNVCLTYYDYLWENTSSRCYYNPDLIKTMPELVTQHNYPIESYHVTSEDGYIVTLFRMAQKDRKPKGVVFLFHGATSASDVWVDKGNVSLGLSLYNDGYEVWLANSRGTHYSRKHISLNPDTDKVYWDFSFHEMALYDIPPQIELIKNVSKADKITYVGHSMGGTIGVVYAALLPEHAKKNINAFILFSPAVYLNYTSDMTRSYSKYGDEIYILANLFGQSEVMSPTPLVQFIKDLCSNNAIGMVLCSAYIQHRMGDNLGEVYAPFVAQLFSHNPDGIAIKVPVHYYQIVRTRQFRAFDNGPKRNMEMYGSEIPPEYPIENINVPMHILAGAYDALVNYKDSEGLYNKLKNPSMHEIEILPFNHIDFIYGRDLELFLNRKVKQILSLYI